MPLALPPAVNEAIAFWFPGTQLASARERVGIPYAVTLPISIPGSVALARVASTLNPATVTINKISSGVTTAIGSVAFAASATGSFTFSSAVTFASGDMVELVFPSPADATLADIVITLLGTQS